MEKWGSGQINSASFSFRTVWLHGAPARCVPHVSRQERLVLCPLGSYGAALRLLWSAQSVLQRGAGPVDHRLPQVTCSFKNHPSVTFTVLLTLGWIFFPNRGTGRWLTDVSPLLPLLDGQKCTLTMKTAPWAMPWIVSLNLRFSIGNQTSI